MSVKPAFPKYALSLLCAGLLTAPAFAAPKSAAPKPTPPAHATAAADNTSAVAVVSRLLTLRDKNNFAGMYDLLSASMKTKVSRKEFVAVTPASKADIAQMPPALRGQYALFADTRNVLGYTFAVVGPDPTNPDVVLVHAFPKPAPGVVAETLKIYTVAERGKTPRRGVDALGSLRRAMKEAQSEQAVPPAAMPAPPSPDAPAPPPAATAPPATP